MPGARKHGREHKEKHRQAVHSAQCTLSTQPHSASYQPVSYTVYSATDISACTLSLCKQQVALMVLMHQPLLKWGWGWGLGCILPAILFPYHSLSL